MIGSHCTARQMWLVHRSPDPSLFSEVGLAHKTMPVQTLEATTFALAHLVWSSGLVYMPSSPSCDYFLSALLLHDITRPFPFVEVTGSGLGQTLQGPRGCSQSWARPCVRLRFFYLTLHDIITLDKVSRPTIFAEY